MLKIRQLRPGPFEVIQVLITGILFALPLDRSRHTERNDIED